ncbi:hypothetical protein [Mycolicibacterium sp. XJ1904]
MILSRYQVDVAVYGLRQAIELSRLCGVRVRRELPEVLQQVDDLLMFAGEHDSNSATGELNLDDLLGAKAVAAELGCSPQHVGRIADDIGGVVVEGRWVFRRQDVETYKAWKGVA